MRKLFLCARILSLFLILISLSFSSAWGKAKLKVWPVKIALYPKQKIGEVHLTNKGEKDVNVQIYAKSWDTDESGKFVETDTGDFVFYPRLLAIPAGEEKSLKVGYNGTFPPIEKAYRLYIHELPEIAKPEQKKEKIEVGIIPMLRLSLPLFVSPSKSKKKPQPLIDGFLTGAKGLNIGVKNPGSHHFTLQKIEADISGRDKAILASGEAKPHILRILPQRRVFVHVPIDRSVCSDAEKLHLKLFLEKIKEPVKITLPLQKNCQWDGKTEAE